MASTTESLASHLQQSLTISEKDSNMLSPDSVSSNKNSQLSPVANEFKPTFGPVRPPQPNTSPFFDVHEIPGKGMGLVARCDIPISTRIICESPLLSIPWNIMSLVWDEYKKLSATEKEVYGTLACTKSPSIQTQLEAASKDIGESEGAMSAENQAEVARKALEVMQIFATNNAVISDGAHAVFAEFSRINHSCVPNVHHSFSPDVQKKVVHAIRDIRMGDEITTTYLGQEGTLSTRVQRWEYLRTNYGFTCQCVACLDSSGLSDSRRVLLHHLIFGIESFRQGGSSEDGEYVPKSLAQATAQAVDIIAILLDDGLFGMELIRAYRLAAELHFEAHDHRKTLEFATKELEVERNIMGAERDDLYRKGIASEQWIAAIRNRLLEESERDPWKHKEVLEYYFPPQNTENKKKKKKAKKFKKFKKNKLDRKTAKSQEVRENAENKVEQ